MSTFDDARKLIHLLREGRDYFAFAHDEVVDREVAEVFARALRARRELLEDLVTTRLLFQTSPAHATPSLNADTGYEGLRHQFDPHHPRMQAEALYERERQLIGLIEDLFEADSSPKLQFALKRHYAQFVELARTLDAWRGPVGTLPTGSVTDSLGLA
ncbi:hypothetical protein [Tahibacter amnicola]|uniref:DUF2383 domain-containing protein n=1 Tax=Tahibacter amnicola TaxID=2976241 RepID=A0ABY6BDZ0_9GAMM|nr:hypothetical protein [Tahibacter amnicola]UXI67974.1 hypothetical protein N4264_25140 [Tahibacter amnicola]